MVLTPVTINSIWILNAIGLHQNMQKIQLNCAPFQKYFTVLEVFLYRFGNIFVPFQKFSGAFWDVLTQFVKTGSSHPKMKPITQVLHTI